MTSRTFAIRAATTADFKRLKAIEIDAFETLQQAGGVSGEASSSTDAELQHLSDTGILLVAVDSDDIACGYVGASFVEDCLHVTEIDVARDWQRMGIGRALMIAVLRKGRTGNVASATLTTDRLVPFNGPFYASLGFRILAVPELPERLRVILDTEHATGFDPERRVAMICDFDQMPA